MINIPCRRAQVNSHVVPKRAAVEQGMQTDRSPLLCDSRETGEWDGLNGPVRVSMVLCMIGILTMRQEHPPELLQNPQTDHHNDARYNYRPCDLCFVSSAQRPSRRQ